MFFFAHLVHCRHSENRWRNSLAHALQQLGSWQLAVATGHWPLETGNQLAARFSPGQVARPRLGSDFGSAEFGPGGAAFLAKTPHTRTLKVPPLSWLRLFIVMGEM